MGKYLAIATISVCGLAPVAEKVNLRDKFSNLAWNMEHPGDLHPLPWVVLKELLLPAQEGMSVTCPVLSRAMERQVLHRVKPFLKI